MSVLQADKLSPPFLQFGGTGRLLAGVLALVEYLAAVILAADVIVVFLSVIYRYFLHDPLNWAEDIAGALMVMQIFLGAATVLGREQHAGIDAFRGLFPAAWRPALIQLCHWVVVAVAVALLASSCSLLADSVGQTTPIGLPQWIYFYPVVIGSLLIIAFGLAHALAGPPRRVWGTALGCLALTLAILGWNQALPDLAITPILLLVAGFAASLAIGVPIAFSLAFGSLLYFLTDPSLPLQVYSQQVIAGANHFVLLAIPFFVLAGLAMEANGMSSRLIELLLRMVGRFKGGMNLIIICATALFSGISGSKLADIAAVGGIIMPAIRRTRQDPNDAAGLLACTAVMSETIPPCVNMIIFGFVANVSIGGLFMAGLVPAAVLAACLAAVAIWFGSRVDPDQAFETRRSLARLIGGGLVGLVMILMIGRGVSSGIATSTEISAFAVVYALLVGGLAFRELTLRSIIRLFVRSASMTGSILFIVSAASSLSYALTIEQLPQYMSDVLILFGRHYGSVTFLMLSAILMIVFGSVLEGAPALIIFGPLLTPIALQLGIHPLHFGTLMVIAMGFGLFAPPLGLGLFATCAITGTEVQNVARPMMKYLAVLFLGLVALILVPAFSLWLPGLMGLK